MIYNYATENTDDKLSNDEWSELQKYISQNYYSIYPVNIIPSEGKTIKEKYINYMKFILDEEEDDISVIPEEYLEKYLSLQHFQQIIIQLRIKAGLVSIENVINDMIEFNKK